MKTRNHSSAFYIIRDAVIAVALSAAAVATVTLSIAGSEENRRSENLRIIENGVRKAAAECYAVEGFYPDNIGYLIENYDLHIDKNSCIVHYSPVSSNIMPDIRVISK